MKNIFAFFTAILMLAVTASVLLAPTTAISSSTTLNTPAISSIPDSIATILEKSCYPCHSSPASGMAMMKLNFDKWDTYGPEKQADKAKGICKKVTAGKMPTSSFRKNNPDKIPSEKETKILCNWANSFEKK